ncbi:MAG: hypothetical protein JXJ04_20495, partial [Spirochaetales bacterium]|nr:hypothetical protein [Spirochaetales bacterium]
EEEKNYTFSNKAVKGFMKNHIFIGKHYLFNSLTEHTPFLFLEDESKEDLAIFSKGKWLPAIPSQFSFDGLESYKSIYVLNQTFESIKTVQVFTQRNIVNIKPFPLVVVNKSRNRYIAAVRNFNFNIGEGTHKGINIMDLVKKGVEFSIVVRRQPGMNEIYTIRKIIQESSSGGYNILLFETDRPLDNPGKYNFAIAGIDVKSIENDSFCLTKSESDDRILAFEKLIDRTSVFYFREDVPDWVLRLIVLKKLYLNSYEMEAIIPKKSVNKETGQLVSGDLYLSSNLYRKLKDKKPVLTEVSNDEKLFFFFDENSVVDGSGTSSGGREEKYYFKSVDQTYYSILPDFGSFYFEFFYDRYIKQFMTENEKSTLSNLVRMWQSFQFH